MSTKPSIKLVRALHQKKYRAEEGLFLVQGRKLVTELLASDLVVHAIHATQVFAAELNDPRVHIWPAHELERMGTLESGNEVVAVVEQPRPTAFGSVADGELVLAFDGVADPGNMGTLLRIADWFGVRRVLCSLDSVDVYNPKCVQASMGSLFRVQVFAAELAEALNNARSNGTQLYLATMEGDPAFDLELKTPCILVLGSESHGVSAPVRVLNAQAIAVPRVGAAESLNVAAAASALCMEFTRQRTKR